jgi:prepilin-type N-terminal cleavage/methylation domain-containing protein
MRCRGVTLVETLIAMVVLAVSLLAVARLSLDLRLGVEHARTRTEALQHGQSQMEALRGVGFADVAGGADLPGGDGPTTYERTWTAQDVASDRLKRIQVSVHWQDRRGAPQRVALRSLVARADAADAVGLASMPAATRWRGAHARHPAVPPDAQPVQGVRDRSMMPWAGPSGGVLLFDDVSGEVVAHCSRPPEGSQGVAEVCRNVPAYLLQGFVEGRGLASLAIVFDRLQHVAAPPECAVDDAVDPRTHRPIPDTRRYRCLMRPTDHDGNAVTPLAWSGRVRLGGLPEGATVCRWTGRTAGSDEEEHPQTYTLVSRSLDHQNYVVTSAADCPRGAVAHPAA